MGTVNQPATDVGSRTTAPKRRSGKLKWIVLLGGGLLLLVALVLCLGGGGALAGLGLLSSGSPAKAVLQRVPADAVGVFLVRDVAGLHRAYGTDSWYEQMSDEERELLEEWFDDEADLELDVLRDLADAIQMGGVGGISLAVVDDAGMALAVVPVADGEAACEALEDMARDEGVDLDHRSHGDVDIMVDEDDEVAFAAEGGQLLVVFAEDEGAEDYLEDVLDERLGTAWDADWVTSVRSELGGAWHAMLLVNPDLPRDVREELLDEMDLEVLAPAIDDRLRDIEGLGCKLHVGTGEWTADAFLAVREGTTWLSDALGATKDGLAKHVGGDAVVVSRTAINAEAWLEELLDLPEAGDELRDGMREIRRDIGIDIEDDVVPYLGSPVTQVIFDSESGEMPYSMVVWVPLDEGHDMADVLEDVEDAVREQGGDIDTDRVGDTTWYEMEEDDEQLAWAVTRDHLVYAFGRNRIRDLKKELDSPGSSFLDGLGDATARKALKGKAAAVVYLDVAALVDQFDDDIKDDPDTAPLWPLLDGMAAAVLTLEIDGRLARAHASVTAEDAGGFADAVLEMGGGDGGFGNTPMVLRSKRAEGATNLDAIRTAERAYHAEWDSYTSCTATPREVPGRKPTAFSGGGMTSFHNLGWAADGEVLCRYTVDAVNSAAWRNDRFTARAECDVDGDGDYAIYEATQDRRATLVSDPDVY
jgi:hypothetical protein